MSNWYLGKICIAIFSIYAIQAAAEDCSKFIVLDRYSSRTNASTYGRVQDLFCKTEVKDSGSAHNTGVSAGIPIPILDDILSLKFTNESNDWSHWQSAFCSSHFEEVATSLKQTNLAEIFSNNAQDVVKECLKQNNAVYGYFAIDPQGDQFTFSLNVHGAESLKSATLSSDDAVRNCDSSNPFGLGFLDRHITDRDISGQTMEFGCAWDPMKAARLTVLLKNQGQYVFVLPSIAVQRTVVSVPLPKLLPVGSQRFGKTDSTTACQMWSQHQRVEVNAIDADGAQYGQLWVQLRGSPADGRPTKDHPAIVYFDKEFSLDGGANSIWMLNSSQLMLQVGQSDPIVIGEFAHDSTCDGPYAQLFFSDSHLMLKHSKVSK
jgi:hypothetical protein